MHRSRKWQINISLFFGLLLTGCSPDQTEKIESGSDITMYVATDTHYLAPELTDQGKAYQTYLSTSDGRQLEYCDEIMDAFSDDVINQEPDILIISGDLTNNGEKESHLRMAEKLKKIESSGKTRVYVIPGNHDINNPWARGFQGDKQYKADFVRAGEFQKIYRDYGYGEAVSRDKNSLSYLAAPSEDVWLLMLDTNEYDRNDQVGYPMTNGQLTEGTLEWIRKCSRMAEDKNAKIIAVMHHNLFNHNSVMHYGFTLDNGEDVYKVLRECGITLSLSGHMHVQNIKSRITDQKTSYDIITSALIMYPEQYGILDYQPSHGFDYHTEELDVAGWAVSNGLTDQNLTGFEEYSRNSFSQVSYQKAYQLLDKTGIYTDTEKELMANTFSEINRNYFAGTTESIRNEMLASEGYQLWEDADESLFLRGYILSVFPNKVDDNLRMFLPVD